MRAEIDLTERTLAAGFVGACRLRVVSSEGDYSGIVSPTIAGKYLATRAYLPATAIVTCNTCYGWLAARTRMTKSNTGILPSPRQSAHDMKLRRAPAGGNDVGVRCKMFGAGELPITINPAHSFALIVMCEAILSRFVSLEEC